MTATKIVSNCASRGHCNAEFQQILPLKRERKGSEKKWKSQLSVYFIFPYCCTLFTWYLFAWYLIWLEKNIERKTPDTQTQQAETGMIQCPKLTPVIFPPFVLVKLFPGRINPFKKITQLQEMTTAWLQTMWPATNTKPFRGTPRPNRFAQIPRLESRTDFIHSHPPRSAPAQTQARRKPSCTETCPTPAKLPGAQLGAGTGARALLRRTENRAGSGWGRARGLLASRLRCSSLHVRVGAGSASP